MNLTRFVRAEWDRVAGYVFVVAGAVALVFGFVGVRTSADVIDEISYLVTGGIGAIFLLGVGATLLLSADLHDDFRKLHRVEEKLDLIHQALAERHPDLVVDVRPPAPGTDEGNGATAATTHHRSPQPSPAFTAPGRPASVTASGLPRRPSSGILTVRRFRRWALAGGVVAAALFGAGAMATANQASSDHMAGSVGLALSGALVVAVAAGAMVGQLRGRLERRTLAALGPWLAADHAPDGPPPAPAQEVWVVDGLALYHRAGCRALEGRAVTARDRAALSAGARPCGLCEPGPGG